MDFTLLVVIAVVAIALLWFAKVVDHGGTESVVETESRSGANEPAGGCERRICHGRASPVASLPDRGRKAGGERRRGHDSVGSHEEVRDVRSFFGSQFVVTLRCNARRKQKGERTATSSSMPFPRLPRVHSVETHGAHSILNI